uniref:Glycosyl transferase CAP10 domain-containing protein n=1 Tax=Davidia involucrata TaxID=16924 RepID=A0A5B7BFV0_DAVIN
MGDNNNAHATRIIWNYLSGMIEQPWKNGVSMTASLFFIILLVAAIISTHWIDVSLITVTSFQKEFLPSKSRQTPSVPLEMNCSFTCPGNDNVTHKTDDSVSAEACPEYFRWIHEDVQPWQNTGITREMVERAESAAHIRVVIVNGRVYVKKYKKVFQTRDVVTVWGILQLLRLYPGNLPDLDLMFSCDDKPAIPKRYYNKASAPPPLIHYCGDESTFDIVFPDWSFWGWPELHIEPWETVRKELEEGNNGVKWMEREPYAYWKGNTVVGAARRELAKCNVTDKQDWNARIYDLDWQAERQEEFKNTDLASQCTHRYKIYVEGVAWSVSEKYILACDSMNLLITPHYYDFFTRSLVPTIHYWPINENDKCRSIKFAVDWGNNHPQKAQEIGKAGSKFIQEELKMKHVYDYMFHLLYEYAKLLKYQPIVPQGAVEVCSETLACSGKGLKKKYKINSMVKGPADTSPCTMPPPYDPAILQAFLQRKSKLTKQVEMWEETENI